MFISSRRLGQAWILIGIFSLFTILFLACGNDGGGGIEARIPRFAYVANWADNSVSAYTIDATTGALRSVAGSPTAAGTSPCSVTVDPSGKFTYVANVNSNNVSAYTINATTGALTAVAGSPFAVGNYPFSVTVTPSGKFAY